jgi:hypothetical protein
MSSQIHKHHLQLPAPVIIPANIKTTISALRSTRRKLQDLSRRAYKQRKQHQANKADAFAIGNNILSKAALERVQQAKATKEMFCPFPPAKATPWPLPHKNSLHGSIASQ